MIRLVVPREVTFLLEPDAASDVLEILGEATCAKQNEAGLWVEESNPIVFSHISDQEVHSLRVHRKERKKYDVNLGQIDE